MEEYFTFLIELKTWWSFVIFHGMHSNITVTVVKYVMHSLLSQCSLCIELKM